jgi:hypothetical protein
MNANRFLALTFLKKWFRLPSPLEGFLTGKIPKILSRRLVSLGGSHHLSRSHNANVARSYVAYDDDALHGAANFANGE